MVIVADSCSSTFFPHLEHLLKKDRRCTFSLTKNQNGFIGRENGGDPCKV